MSKTVPTPMLTSATGRGASQRAGRDKATDLIVVTSSVVTAVLAYYQLSRPGMLFGVTGIDDGAYFGTAIRLVHGVLPYRDYVAMHPPGMPLLLSPIALLSNAIGTRNGLVICRLVMPAVAAADVFVVGRVIRHHGRLATLVACSALALQPDFLVSVHTVELEPVLALFCLLGIAMVFDGDTLGDRRRLLWGGVLFGVAGAVKVWAIFPVVMLALVCLVTIRRTLGPFVVGVAVGFLAPCVVFIAAAPRAFFHDVVVAQVGRVGGHRVPIGERMIGLTGVRDLGSLARYPDEVAVVIALFVAGAYLYRRRSLSQFDWFVFGSTALLVVAFVAPEQFFSHYSAFFAPFLALALGLAAARIAEPHEPKGVFLLVVIVSLGLALNAEQYITAGTGVDIKPAHVIPAIDSAVPAGACVLSDNASLPILANRFLSSRASCPPIVDAFGTSVADGTGLPLQDGGPIPKRLVAVWINAFHHADYVVLDGLTFAERRIPLVPSITSYLDQEFRLVVYKPGGFSGLLVYARNGFPTH